ncbi:hypothetical protein JA1_004997 [Spathaspora sp. JA1]|nr:hypothetical protein JA1_004997 [Spathaspora sp. JA1]
MVILNETKKERHERFTNQLIQAGISGMVKASMFALASGYFLSYKFNHGKNTGYFRNTYKLWWFVGWNIVGITWGTDIAKINIAKQAALEDEIKRNLLFEEELKQLPK